MQQEGPLTAEFLGASWKLELEAISRDPGVIQKVDPPQAFMIYAIGALESRIGSFTFWILSDSRGSGSGWELEGTLKPIALPRHASNPRLMLAAACIPVPMT